MSKYEPPTNESKWLISLYSGILFLIIASPMAFKAVNYFTSMLKLPILDYDDKPNVFGYLLHAIVFILIVRLSMGV
jgi:hypothetical protein